MVTAIGNGFVKGNDPSLLKHYGGHLKLTGNWARRLFNSTNWVKRKEATGQVETLEQFLKEKKISFQRALSQVVIEHDILPELVINLDQTPLLYISPEKYTYSSKGSKNVSLKVGDDKIQITATYVAFAVDSFLQIQLISDQNLNFYHIFMLLLHQITDQTSNCPQRSSILISFKG